MGVYTMNEAAFELPELGLVDRTVTHLEAGRRALLIHRAPIPAGETLTELVAKNLRDAAIRLHALRLLFQREIEIAGCPAVELATEWRGAAGPMYTRQAHLAVGATWLVFAASAPHEDRAACDETIELALATFRLRD